MFRSLSLAASIAMMLSSIGSPVNAEVQTLTVKQYQQPQSDQDLISNKAYLSGIKDGIVAFNMTLDEKQICLPENRNLTFERASEILMRWARGRNGSADSLPLALGMLHSLREAYPCSGRRQ